MPGVIVIGSGVPALLSTTRENIVSEGAAASAGNVQSTS